jgi:2-amino-4-hydroxy-6-hydroxymethyldihydropteridine diphosphokinase
MLTEAIISLGANLPSIYGSPVETIQEAFEQIDEIQYTELVKVSHIIETEPIDIQSSPFDPDSKVPQFFNAVCKIQTELGPERLLDELQKIEDSAGRERHIDPKIKISRTLDLDIIEYGEFTLTSGKEYETDRLTIPHPLAARRSFVMDPLHSLSS